MVTLAGVAGRSLPVLLPRAPRRQRLPVVAGVGAYFVACLASMAPAQGSVLDRLPPEADVAAHRRLAFGREFTPVDLPGDGMVMGLAAVGDTLWLRRDDDLLCIDWPSRTVRRRLAAPPNSRGLAADAGRLWLVLADAVVEFDAEQLAVRRQIAVPADGPMVVRGTELFVVGGNAVRGFDLARGAVTSTAPCAGPVVQWLATDGTRLLAGDGVDCVDVAAGPLRRWPALLRDGVATWIDGKLLLAADQSQGATVREPICGLLDLAATRPAWRMRVDRRGEHCVVECGAGSFVSLDSLQQHLRRLAADPSVRVVGPDGKSRAPRIELYAGTGVRVRELKDVLQAVVTSGFPDVVCPHQQAWWDAAQSRPAGTPPTSGRR